MSFEAVRKYPALRQDVEYHYLSTRPLVLTEEDTLEGLNHGWMIYVFDGEHLLVSSSDFTSEAHRNRSEYEMFADAPETEAKLKALWLLKEAGREAEWVHVRNAAERKEAQRATAIRV